MMRTFSKGNSRSGRGCRRLLAGATIVLTLAGAGGLGTARGQVITTVAGAGVAGYSGDGGAATAARLNSPYGGVAVDSAGNLYIADTLNNRIRKVTTVGVISTVAGVGVEGYFGDGGAATAAQLFYPHGVAVDSAGNLYIADTINQCVRKVTAFGGVISTVAGTGSPGYSGDDGRTATSAQLFYPHGVAVDSAGNLYIADNSNYRIRKVTALGGVISTVAGTGSAGYSGDGGSATAAQLMFPTGVAVDSAGNLYIADYYDHRIRKVTAAGVISTVAGTGSAGYSGDGAAATAAQLFYPHGVAVDSAGNLYIADDGNHRIRKVTAAGVISTVAGTGVQGYSGDGGAATAAQLNSPYGAAVDSAGNLYIADRGDHRIRKVTFGCTYTISPANASMGAGGGTGSVSVNATTGCPWVASSNAAWISITSGASGTGPDTVRYSVAANASGIARTGTLTIAGQTFTVTQATAGCTYSIAPTSSTMGAGGFTATVAVTAAAGCNWVATSNANWITITSGSSGSGSGAVNYSVSANTSTSSRTGTMTIAGQTFTVTQAGAGCTYSIDATSISVGAGASTARVTVTASAGCNWTATSNVSWITITSGGSGSGSGTVNYSVAANTSTSARTGTLTIAGQTFTVTQAGAGCTYSIDATSISVGAGASTARVTVTASAGCNWTATSNVSWITITSGSPGNGSGTVNYSVAANTGTSSRTGTLTIAGQTFTVTQQGLAAVTGVTISGLSASGTPLQQLRVGIGLASAYGVALTGTVTLAFAADAVNPMDDQTVAFPGGRTVNCTVAADGTQASFATSTANQFSTGTTAGRITVTVSFRAGSVDVTPSPAPSASVQIARGVPVITNVAIVNRTTSGFELHVTGYATSREVTQATFQFSGSNLQTTSLTADAAVNTAFTNWYRGAESTQFGSSFKYVQAFTVSQGSVSSITSATVTLRNSLGNSTPASVNF